MRLVRKPYYCPDEAMGGFSGGVLLRELQNVVAWGSNGRTTKWQPPIQSVGKVGD
jgi:hypothetical protein